MAQPATRDFDLTGLLTGRYYCSGCAGRVCDEALAIEGVMSAECDLEAGSLQVTFDPSAIKERDLEAAVVRIALETEGRVTHAAYRVAGLD